MSSDRTVTRRPGGRRSPDITVSLDSTMPPTRIAHRIAVDGAGVLAITHDADLSTAIKKAAADQFPIRIMDDWNEFVAQVESRAGRIVLIDVDALTMPVDRALTELYARADWLVIVIATKQQQAQEFMRLWSERKIHRLLIKPAAVGISRLLLESAVERFAELRDAYEGVDDDSITLPSHPRPQFENKRPWRIPALLVCAAAIVAGAWYYGAPYLDSIESLGSLTSSLGLESGPPPAGEPQADPFAEADSAAEIPDPNEATAAESFPTESPNEDPFAVQLEMADLAVQESRLATPEGDNALDRYLAVLAAQPDHPRAVQGLDRVLEALFSDAEAALLAGNLDSVEQTVAHLNRAAVDSDRLKFLARQLEQEKALAAAAAVNRAAAQSPAQVVAVPTQPAPPPVVPAPDPVAAELNSLLTISNVRLEQNLLLEPPGDSAVHYATRAAAIDPDGPAVAALIEQLGQALLAAARAALAAEDLTSTQRAVDAASQLGVDPEATAAIEIEIASTMAARERRATDSLADMVEMRLTSGQLVAPSGDSALDHYLALAMRDSGGSRTVELGDRLVRAVLERANAAIDNGDFNVADGLVAALSSLPVDRAVASRLADELLFERRQAEFLQTAVAINELEIVTSATPSYPRAAVRSNVSGWVVVEFVVDADGLPGSVAVVDAEPVGVFEDAAVNAITRYVFMPFELDGRVYRRRARVRMRFDLD